MLTNNTLAYRSIKMNETTIVQPECDYCSNVATHFDIKQEILLCSDCVKQYQLLNPNAFIELLDENEDQNATTSD
mgnify:CR=1 FL=1